MDAKGIIADLLPPIVYRALRRLPIIRRDWDYVGRSWPAADPRAAGWDDPSVVARMRTEWAAYAAALNTPEPFALWPWDTRGRDPAAYNNLMAFVYSLARAARGKHRLSVLDWGGGFGNFFLVARAAVPDVALDYVVKDRPATAAAGAEINPHAAFVATDDAAFSRQYDVVLASNALQYAAEWRTVARRLAGCAEQWLLLLTVPAVRQVSPFVIVQRPRHVGFASDYVSWVFNREDLLNHVAAQGMRLEREFLSSGTIYCRRAPEEIVNTSWLFRRVEPAS